MTLEDEITSAPSKVLVGPSSDQRMAGALGRGAADSWRSSVPARQPPREGVDIAGLHRFEDTQNLVAYHLKVICRKVKAHAAWQAHLAARPSVS